MDHKTKQPAFDVEFARKQFPFFDTDQSKKWALFDNAGGTVPCRSVVDKLTYFYQHNKIQPYGDTALAAAAGEQMDKGRSVIAQLLGVPIETLTIGPSTTQNFNTLSIACAALLNPGDEIIVSEQDHESNIGGWERVAQLTDAILRFWAVNPDTGELDLPDLEKQLNRKTKIISVTQSSNVLGTLNPVPKITRLGHSVGAKVIIDGVSCAPHQWPDLSNFEADAYCFSTYKTYGTHLGIMYMTPSFIDQVTPQCHFFNVEKTWSRLDAAGPDHASIAALAGLGDFFQTLHAHHFNTSDKPLYIQAAEISKLMHQHEMSLCNTLLDGFKQSPIRIIGKPSTEGREANVSLISSTHSSTSLNSHLAKKDIVAKNGHFYAFRLLKRLGIDTNDGVLRLSFAHYNTQQETMRLIEALTDN